MLITVPDCYLMLRETSAPHFDSADGEFRDDLRSEKCVPHWGNYSFPQGLPGRTNLLLNAAEAQSYSVIHPCGFSILSSPSQNISNNELTLIPFYNFSAKLPFLHPNVESFPDCTHFCYTPHLWPPIWRYIRNALDRRVEQMKK